MSRVITDGLARMRALVHDALHEVFAPVPDQTLAEWAEAHYVLPPTAAEGGKPFRNASVPYLRGILDALGSDHVREVVFCKSAQVAGSTIGEIFIAWRIAVRPRAMVMIWPTEKKLKDWSRFRLNPMLEDVAPVAAKFRRTGRREASDTLTRKEFLLGWLALLTAKSTSDLKSLSAPDVIFEELDEWATDVDEQGDAVSLGERANRTYPWRKNYKVSTPTLDGASRIWEELGRSSWHEFWVPCPHCQAYQTLRWRDGDEDPGAPGAYHLIWERDAGGQPIPRTTRYACAACGAEIEERWRMWMLERGEWRARFPERTTTLGFHINTLYFPKVPWDDVVAAFEKGRRSESEMKVFVNTWLGLPYRQQGERHLDIHFLQERAEDYGDGVDVPDGVGVLVAGVDVQSSSGGWLDCHCWGFGAGEEMWLIAAEQLEGDPAQAAVWESLEAWRLRPWRHASGATLRIAAMAIDASYEPEMVHRYADPRGGQNVIPVIGRGGPGRRLLKAPAIPKYRKGARRTRPSYVVGVDTARSILYARLGVKTPGPEYVHFPVGQEQNYYEQLTAHRLITTTFRGRPVREWVLVPNRRKEAEDGAIYAMAALQHLGPLVRRQLGERAQQLSAYVAPPAGADPTAPGAPLPRRRGLVSEQEL